jgi:ATP-dependent helicase/nuclease subunit B
MATVELLLVAAGRAFTIAVDAAVREAQRDDPLRPITVIVPSNTAGLSLRRLLGSNLLVREGRSDRAGIANVGFATPFQFASTLAAGRLAAEGQRPLTTAVLAAGVRHELARDPGRFAAVAQHSATEAALVRAYAELTELSPDERAFLTEHCSARTAEVIGFVETVSRHLSDPARTHRYHDEFAVFAAAAESLSTPSPASDGRVGAVVIAGPFEQGESTKRFLGTVASHIDGAAVCALTGAPLAFADNDTSQLPDYQLASGISLLAGRLAEDQSLNWPQVRFILEKGLFLQADFF